MFASGGYALVRGAPEKLWRWIRSKILYTITIDDEEPLHLWMMNWLAQREISRNVRPKITWIKDDVAVRAKPKILFRASGFFHFKHSGKRFLGYNRIQMIQGQARPKEELTLSCIGDGRKFMEEMCRRAFEHHFLEDAGKVDVFMYNGSWYLASQIRGRPLNSVFLPSGLGERLLEDARNFLASRDWYVKRGVPWRRSYLFLGSPGGGKTTTAQMLAHELGMSISVINVNSFCSDSGFMLALAMIPRGHILLIEDVDALWVEKRKGESISISFSAFLNAIDGVCSREGRITIMTTNHLERLDPALTRPGRADLKIEFGPATEEQVAAAHACFFPGREIGSFVDTYAGQSMAAVQNALLDLSRAA